MSQISLTMLLITLINGICLGEKNEIKDQMYDIIHLMYLTNCFDSSNNLQAISLTNSTNEHRDSLLLAVNNALQAAIKEEKIFSPIEFLAQLEIEAQAQELSIYTIQELFVNWAGLLYSQINQNNEQILEEKNLQIVKNIEQISSVLESFQMTEKQTLPKTVENKNSLIWIMGARRSTMIERITFFKEHVINNSIIKYSPFLLTGERELYAELDKLPTETIWEMITYMKNLADKHNIPYDKNQSTILYKTNPPKGRLANKTYLNTTGEHRLTETIAMIEIYQEIVGDSNYILINTPQSKDGQRSNTYTTTIDAMSLTEKTFPETSSIVIISNQPHILRQTHIVKNVIKGSNFISNSCVYGIGPKLKTNQIIQIKSTITEIMSLIYHNSKQLKIR
ncbi:hypothetical protein CAXC1_120044 [Candidatus Xenohaliotis californiensis]|uniref:DUF218 domain-containing protein n=1 Tax=Candidatus Xenohaliotis californiensis TaxID=84677 RepID=A0ABM9N7U3_9RICK|nr:hypothetical protein CAXC1_120044 [Candidatus Xenohaliotis californiensis]